MICTVFFRTFVLIFVDSVSRRTYLCLSYENLPLINMLPYQRLYSAPPFTVVIPQKKGCRIKIAVHGIWHCTALILPYPAPRFLNAAAPHCSGINKICFYAVPYLIIPAVVTCSGCHSASLYSMTAVSYRSFPCESMTTMTGKSLISSLRTASVPRSSQAITSELTIDLERSAPAPPTAAK